MRISQPFYLAKYPVTQAQWQRVMGDNPSYFKGANRPVESVSWQDAQAFIEQLNRLESTQQYHLPTEAQWEYACRAGTQGARYHEDLDAIAWYRENSAGETHEVGHKAPNCWGLYDMLGNVFEWCNDGMHAYTDALTVGPVGPTDSDTDRVIRGGGWGWVARYVRAALRHADPPSERSHALGFRCASSVSQASQVRATLSGLERPVEPAETAKRLPAARSVRIQGEATLYTGIPQGKRFTIKTDRERLRFGQITKPQWASDIGRDVYGLWVRLQVDGVHQRLRWIPPGRFWMGSAVDDPQAFESEQSRHQVDITRGFWLFDTPCTQEVWLAVMESNPSRFQGARRPVEQVGWHDCQMFMQHLNERFSGLALALPTEGQWEYACRAGTEGARYHEDLDAIAWYEANSDGETHEVGQKIPNRWGLYDMLGNVFEWCHDGLRAYRDTPAVDPMGPMEAGARRVVRGGGWRWHARLVRAAYRNAAPPGDRLHSLGFRCASSG